VLPAANRLRRPDDFRAVLRGSRGGRRPSDDPPSQPVARSRAGGTLLVVHVAMTDPTGATPPRVGLVVSAAVGGAVVRNRTARRLRHQLRDRLAVLPTGCDVVVRAQPAAAAVDSAALGAELDRLLPVAVRRVS